MFFEQKKSDFAFLQYLKLLQYQDSISKYKNHIVFEEV